MKLLCKGYKTCPRREECPYVNSSNMTLQEMADWKKGNIGDAKSVSLKSCRKALEGKCPTCGTKVFKFVKS